MSPSETESELYNSLDSIRVLKARENLHSFTAETLNEWIDEHTVINHLGNQAYRMLVAPGNNPEAFIFAAGELGNGLNALGAIARIRTIQAIVDPDATIVYQPNSTSSQDNVNFSKEERQEMRKGNLIPLTDRVLNTINTTAHIESLSVYGPSQGGAVALSLAAHPSLPPTAATIIETPNVINRSVSRLVLDFATSGASLKETISNNYELSAPLRRHLVEELSAIGLLGYAHGLLHPDNTSFVHSMRNNSSLNQMKATLDKKGSVVHAWGDKDDVSPHQANRAIAEELSERKKYASYELEGDHSVTNAYFLNAALMQRAVNLLGDEYSF